MKVIDKAKAAGMVQDLQSIKHASMVFYADTGQYPVYVNGITYSLINSYHPLLTNVGVTGWDGPYLEREARGPSWTKSLPSTCPSIRDYYYTQWYGGWTKYYGQFDLDNDGSYENITTRHSISICPVPPSIRKGVNLILDDQYMADDSSGRVKVNDGCTGIVTLYVGAF